MPKLTNEINLKFVQLYREEECLWNASIPSYKDKSMRDSALQKICGELLKMGIEMNIKDVKNKIKNLRATYSQELTKIDKSIRSGAGSQDEYKPKLNWFHEMHSFIKSVPMKRKTTDSLESAYDEAQANTENSPYTIDNSNENNDNEMFINNDDNVANLENISPTPTSKNMTQQNKSLGISAKSSSQPMTQPMTPGPKKKKMTQMASLVSEIRSISNDLNKDYTDHTIIPQQNEHDIFGAYVASQLKMLSSIQAIIARDEINSILSRRRMLDINSSFTIVSSCDSNLNSGTNDDQQQDLINTDVIATAFKNA